MKSFKIFSLIVFALVGVLVMSASDMFEDDAAGDLYRYDFRTSLDTLTDAGTETFTVPALLYSKWAYHWDFSATQLTGTTNLTCAIQEQAVTDGEWIQVDTIDLDGTSTGRVVGPIVYGVKQRCVCTGTGTQSTQIDAYVVYKKD
jgi:hypothetical protein